MFRFLHATMSNTKPHATNTNPMASSVVTIFMSSRAKRITPVATIAGALPATLPHPQRPGSPSSIIQAIHILLANSPVCSQLPRTEPPIVTPRTRHQWRYCRPCPGPTIVEGCPDATTGSKQIQTPSSLSRAKVKKARSSVVPRTQLERNHEEQHTASNPDA